MAYLGPALDWIWKFQALIGILQTCQYRVCTLETIYRMEDLGGRGRG